MNVVNIGAQVVLAGLVALLVVLRVLPFGRLAVSPLPPFALPRWPGGDTRRQWLRMTIWPVAGLPTSTTPLRASPLVLLGQTVKVVKGKPLAG